MPRKKQGLGPAFSCRLREEQDRLLRADAAFHDIPLVEALRRRLDKADAAVAHEAELAGDGDDD